jgi:hypothetical protein
VAVKRSHRTHRPSERPQRPATTPEGRENQLISLATDLAERQLRDGSASAQVLTHFLKLASSREQLEQQRLERENLLLSAKIEQIASGQRIEELYMTALDAMRQYSGRVEAFDDDGLMD